MSRVESDSYPFPTSALPAPPANSPSVVAHLITEANRNEIFFPLSRLASFSANWESLAQHPKFSRVQPSDVSKIRRQHPDDVDLQAFEFLMTWYQRYERRCRTVTYLIEALKAAGLFLAAESLEEVSARQTWESSAETERNGNGTSGTRENSNHDGSTRSMGKRCNRCISWSSVESEPKRPFDGAAPPPSTSSIPPELGLFRSFGDLSVADDSRSELPCYPLNRNPLGFAILINNQNYQQDPTIEGSKRFDNREGTKKDAERLR